MTTSNPHPDATTMVTETCAACAYSLPHYRHILRQARELGYWLPLVRDVAFGVPDRKFFLVRHDVDVNPWAALEMARFEAEEGVATTYYFRLHAPTYNLLDQKTRDLVLEIAGMGHEVGLHYEPGFYIDRDRDPVEGSRRDIRVFEELVGFRTYTIAQHQPSIAPFLGEVDPERKSAYQPALIRDIAYFGDSGHHWREGCVCIKLGQHEQIHTLIHPSSWTIWDRPWQEVLRAHAADLNHRLTEEMEAYIQILTDYLAVRGELDAEREALYR